MKTNYDQSQKGNNYTSPVDLGSHTLLHFRILFIIKSSISLSLVSKTGIAVSAIHPRDCSTAGKCVFSSNISTSLCKLRKNSAIANTRSKN
jgi:hypothetical protein